MKIVDYLGFTVHFNYLHYWRLPFPFFEKTYCFCPVGPSSFT